MPHVPATVIVGAQWGDEGKGKIVDLLAQESDLVCRYQGGPNAGHTIVVEGERAGVESPCAASGIPAVSSVETQCPAEPEVVPAASRA